MQKLVLTRAYNIRPKVKRLLEQSAGGRNPYDALIFIDDEDNVRIAGDDLESRFGNVVDAYAPTCVFPLPSGEKAAKVFASRYIIFILATSGNVYATGHNTEGNCALPAGSGVVNVATPTLTAISNCKTVAHSTAWDRSYSVMFLTNTGQVYSAGINQYGQLGDGTTTNSGNTGPRLTLGPGNTYGNPTTTVIDIISVGGRDVSSNVYMTTYCALLSNGTVWCVGYGGNGQMGNNTTTTTNSTWQQVRYITSDLAIQNIVRIFGCGREGNTTLYALDSSGNLYSWGYNIQGQLAIGSGATNSSRANLVSGNVLEVWPFNAEAGSIIVKKTDNLFYAAGHNGRGQLGVGDTVNKTSLTLISALSNKNIEQLYICGTDAPMVWAKVAGSNRIYSTGWNGQGQLGQYTTTQVNTFTEVPFNVTSPIIDIMPLHTETIGGYTLILTADGNTYFTGQTRWTYVGEPARNETMFRKNTKYIVGA